eukprot:TRINITY_DN22990_c0_g1_i1.p1 TRINITY_DN22990_c0_g1~~TRINITY_DN22990_c0_g1_i1.p1  ORF type:complete len:120 (-),score=42.25 TRINITY_DN22990_c0_g1_i1:140-499(-)
MFCSKCDCSFYLARAVMAYANTLILGCVVGLVMGSVVMWYQSSLLNKEWRVLEEERDLYLGKGKVCQTELGEKVQRQGEEVKQLERVKEGLLLDKDILNQLKVNLQFKVQQKVSGKKKY